MTDNELRALIDSMAPWVIQKRRELHKIPERGFQEFKTQALIKSALDELQIPYQADRTWVIGLIEGAHPGPTIALRADIDALPIQEPDGPLASEHPGMMHACGHDAHTAILLGAANVLNSIKDQLRGNVKLLFQPAEETVGGALPMIEAGALKNPDVDEIFGVHMQPYLPTGTIETRVGCLNAAPDELLIKVVGKSGHGAYPEFGRDAILASAQVISALHTITSRNISPLHNGVITIGTIQGGSANNVLCGEVRLHGTIRSTNKDVRETLHARAVEAAEHAALSMGCTAEVEIVRGYPALINHAAPVDRVLAVGQRLLGTECALIKDDPSMGGEDFSFFLEDVPGAFYNVGCNAPGSNQFAMLHNQNFAIDEDSLAVGVLMQVALVLDAMNKED